MHHSMLPKNLMQACDHSLVRRHVDSLPELLLACSRVQCCMGGRLTPEVAHDSA